MARVSRTSSRRSREQEPIELVSVETIMRTPAFAAGVTDARAGKGPRPAYERWDDPNAQWDYERGRQWALLTPHTVPLRRKGRKLNPVAVFWYHKNMGRGIL
jgi:hypothetical protein